MPFFPRRLRHAATAAALLAMAAPAPAMAIDTGAYLAARVASFHGDFAAAARYYSRALTEDPDNPMLLDSTIMANIGLGQIDSAATLSDRLAEQGEDSQVAALVLVAVRAADGDWDRAAELVEDGDLIGPLFDGLLRGWASVGEGNLEDALDAFDAVTETQGVQAFGLYHKALALAMAGRFAEAEEIFDTEENGGLQLTRRGVIARAQVLSQLGRNDEALTLIDESFGPEPDAALQALRAPLEAGETLEFDAARSARDGLAETFHTIAIALNGEAGDNYTLIYSRLAQYLRPDHVEATLMSAGLLESLGQLDLAVAAYGRVPADHPSFETAELGRAEALRRAGEVDRSISVMEGLIARNPGNALLHIALGDALRGAERLEESRAAYSDAIDLFESETQSQWVVYFTRGIVNERTDRWDEAEADFRRALELNPDQPQVLNYLGYSLVIREEKLDEALDMIERAVSARPDSGHIVDSLGWVLFRLGRYDEAVEPMERAVELMPIDPVVNDHLGDVYWAVGRYREAEFQWKRALSFVDRDETGEADPDRIRRKIEVGLDQVLADEGAEPLAVVDDG